MNERILVVEDEKELAELLIHDVADRADQCGNDGWSGKGASSRQMGLYPNGFSVFRNSLSALTFLSVWDIFTQGISLCFCNSSINATT
ncbi:hypothetical protein [uncultured Faecalibaculum sp.]|uniref:hypothetical protein n=1 Tax=uncultured Faecalibaculum sp. TaxID=1729681 RepID=UPI0026189C5B|nr:hypothetical protein [uncultured Faecalibaculum sp.]